LGEMTGSTIPWRQLSGWNGRRSRRMPIWSAPLRVDGFRRQV
jgi:hypothetical protein